MKPSRQAQRIPAQRRGRRRAGPPPGARRIACAALLSCAAMLAACGGGGGSSTAPPEMMPMPPGPTPPAAQATLTVMAGGSASGGGSVSVAVGSGVAGVVGAGASSSVAAAGDTVTLTATAADGWAFAGWTLSGGLACADGPAGNPCTLAAGSLSADATAEAAFALVATTLTVSAGPNGSVDAEVDGADAVTVAAGESTDVAVSVLSSATTLTAVASAGHAFTGWALAGGNGSLACAGGDPSSNPCTLALGSFSADATATASFEVVQRTLTAAAGPNGSVDVEVDGADAVTVAARESTDVAVSVLSAATLTATASGGYAFTGWVLSVGLACAEGAPSSNPCTLALGSLSAGATAEAAFDPVATTLTLTAGPGGSVSAEVDGADAVTVAAGESTDVAVSVLSAATTLTAVASAGHAFTGWALAGGNGSLACAGGAPSSNPCTLALGSFSADATATATFEAVQRTLTVSAGANGSVDVEATVDAVAGDAVTVDAANPSREFPFNVEATATLTATALAGYAFSAWTGACEGQGAACALDGVAGSTATAAAFGLIATTLTVSAGANGSVDVEATVDAVAVAAVTVDAANPSREFPFNVEATATLTATALAGYAFSAWTGACEGQGAACALDDVVGDAEAAAAFVVLSTLTVTAGPNGSVAVKIGVADAVEVGADSSQGFTVSVLSAATLTATAASGHTFTGWTLSGPLGLACASGAQANPCVLPAGSLSAGATAEAAFARPPAAWRGPGSVSTSPDGPTHTAVPYAPGAFENWAGAPCDGSAQPECDVSSVADSAGFPAAVFRPFAVGGIKSLAFGLGYHGDPPDHFEVSFRDASGAGFMPVPGLESLAPSSGPARLAVPVHLLPWGVGAYLTEACDAANSCEAASGGQRTLEQTDSVAATGYFKAPNADANDQFGWDIALSGDGATLAVGAPAEDSASSGTFAPGGMGYETALDSDGASFSGAVTVYRRSDSEWSLEAFVKAPVAGDFDAFGGALALSGDGATLAVGAPTEDSASTGTFAPGGEGYQAALDSDGASNSGAVTVYRRSDTNAWEIEAFVKAPEAGTDDQFGHTLALSEDSSTLAVGGRFEDSASTGTFAPGGMGYQAALGSNSASNSGAVTVYRRSDTNAWEIEAFVKAPAADAGDRFGTALALSADGTTLAVGAIFEDSASTGTFAPGDEGYQTALDSDGASGSGAVTVYRRSTLTDTWAIEAFVKAPVTGEFDQFGSALALSADGATLAVGAPEEDSASTGTFAAPGGMGYQAALDSDGAVNSGAVTVYRRSEGNDWEIEAFVKAPVAGADQFGEALALSADGATLAVGAPEEDSVSAGTFTASDGDGYQAALGSGGASGSGAVTVYRRSDSTWSVEAFVKAPVAGADDQFGDALALDSNGTTLAVGAINEDGGALSQPVGGNNADAVNAVEDSGAVYLY